MSLETEFDNSITTTIINKLDNALYNIHAQIIEKWESASNAPNSSLRGIIYALGGVSALAFAHKNPIGYILCPLLINEAIFSQDRESGLVSTHPLESGETGQSFHRFIYLGMFLTSAYGVAKEMGLSVNALINEDDNLLAKSSMTILGDLSYLSLIVGKYMERVEYRVTELEDFKKLLK